MHRLWLLIDAAYLCRRAFHALQGADDAVHLGLLGETWRLRQEFEPHGFAFCFDRGESLRKKLCPEYKTRRKASKGKQHMEGYYEQLDVVPQRLRETGFANVFCHAGYEADDLIAQLCLDLAWDERAVIVTADEDFYQCLSDKVEVWHPHKKRLVTEAWLLENKHLTPQQWVELKAVAGCYSDNVKGVKGAGPVNVTKWINGEHIRHKTVRDALERDAEQTRERNLPLVRLPFEGTPRATLQDDAVDWEALGEQFGGRAPRPKRKERAK